MKKLFVFFGVLMMTIFLTSAFAPRAEAKRTVRMWSYAKNNVEEWESRKADIEARFNINLDIELVAQNAFVQKLQAVMMEGRNVPDVIEWMIDTNRILNADPKKSFVIPLDKYIAESEIFPSVVKGRVQWVTYGNHVYGLPHDVHPVVLVYNDTLWKSVGVDLAQIKTWDEFFEKSKKLTEAKKGGKPIHYALPYGKNGLNNTMFMIWQQTGSQILDTNGRPDFTSPKFTAFVKKWLAWQKTNAFSTWDWGNFSALLANGTLASYISPDWWIPQVDEAAKRYKFKVRDLPMYSGGSPTTASWGGTFLAIPKGTENPDQIFSIIEAMQYDKDAMIVRWEKTCMLPPMANIWDHPAFKKADSRFGGQPLGSIMVSSALDLPKINTGDVFWDAISDFAGEYTEMATGKKSVEDGLVATQTKAMNRIEK
jgi:arabinosaccharide transport system substrate-binding protein